MARYEVHQTDGNAEDIYKAARKLGFSVEVINRPVDALFGIYDQTVAVEVKQADGKLESKQTKFFQTFKGFKRIVRTTKDVIALYRELRVRHDLIFPINAGRPYPAGLQRSVTSAILPAGTREKQGEGRPVQVTGPKRKRASA